MEQTNRPVDANGNAIYRIPESNLDALKARVEKLNRRALKLKLDPLVLSEVGEAFEERSKAANDCLDEFEQSTRRVKYTIRLVLATLTGVCPRVNGWAMAATVQHEEGGNVIRTVPGFDLSLPLRYRTAGTSCEHCNTDRRRVDTYVLFNADTDSWKQVGRNCLADFLRTASASGLAEWAEILASLDDELGVYEDEGFGGGGHAVEYFRAVDFLAEVAAVIRVDGWCSRGEAKDQFGKIASVDYAFLLQDDKFFRKLPAAKQKAYGLTDADKAKAAESIAWAQALPEDVSNDFLWNIRVVSNREFISRREAGLAGSIISAYNRHIERELQRKYQQDHPSEHFGEIGKRAVFTLTVMGFRFLEGNFGPTTLVFFRDQDGNRAKWFASGDADGFKSDETYTVKATVKDHDEYNGSKQTLLSRVAIYDAAAEAAAKTAKKEQAKRDRAAAKAAPAPLELQGVTF